MSRAGLTDPILLEVDAIATPVSEIRAAIQYLLPIVSPAAVPAAAH